MIKMMGNKLGISLIVTAIAFIAAFAMNSTKIYIPAPAHRILTLYYKAESAVANQMKILRDNENNKPTPIVYEIVPGYTIDLQPAKQDENWFYRILLSYPGKESFLQIMVTPEQPDKVRFK